MTIKDGWKNFIEKFKKKILLNDTVFKIVVVPDIVLFVGAIVLTVLKIVSSNELDTIYWTNLLSVMLPIYASIFAIVATVIVYYRTEIVTVLIAQGQQMHEKQLARPGLNFREIKLSTNFIKSQERLLSEYRQMIPNDHVKNLPNRYFFELIDCDNIYDGEINFEKISVALSGDLTSTEIDQNSLVKNEFKIEHSEKMVRSGKATFVLCGDLEQNGVDNWIDYILQHNREHIFLLFIEISGTYIREMIDWTGEKQIQKDKLLLKEKLTIDMDSCQENYLIKEQLHGNEAIYVSI